MRVRVARVRMCERTYGLMHERLHERVYGHVHAHLGRPVSYTVSPCETAVKQVNLMV